MAKGLEALVAAATEEPLPFRVRMYVGNLMVTGRVAPSHWWYRLTQKALEAELRAHEDTGDHGGSGRWGKAGRRSPDPEAARELVRQSRGALAALTSAERFDPIPGDEVTLVEVRIYPADFRNDTAGGSQQLAVVRIPLASVGVWWIVEEETMPGSGGNSSAWGVGVILPIGS